MRSLLIYKIIIILTVLPAVAWSQNAMDILEKSVQMDYERRNGVTNYTVDQSMMNHRMLLYFEKIEGSAEDGTPYSTFRLVSPAEVAERKGQHEKLSPEELRLMADKYEETGAALSDEMNKSGMPAGMLGAMGPPPGEEPWASPDPRVSMGTMADFLRAAATAQENESDGTVEAAEQAQQMRQFAAAARFMGTETIDGKSAFHVRADNLDYTPPVPPDQASEMEGQQFTVNAVSLWLDTDEYVPLKFRMDGTMVAEGQTREMYIEKIDQDYRRFGSLYESTKQIMKMGGVLSPQQMAEMKEAQQKLDEMDRQFESMTDQQKQMMESMVGPQLDMLRNMVKTGGFVVETIVHDIKVDAGLPDLTLMGIRAVQQTPGGPSYEQLAAGYPAAPAGAAESAPAAAESPAAAPTDLQAAQQACLERKIKKKQAKAEKKRGLKRLMGAVGRVAYREGNYDLYRTTTEIYHADATAKDIAIAAEELGISKKAIKACENPGQQE